MRARVTSVWQEFKSFAFKGNMIDLAVGVIIGAAFGRVITALVDNVFMPLIVAAGPGGKKYEDLSFMVRGSEVKYGLFLAALLNFFIVAAVVFVFIVKLMGAIIKRTESTPAPSEPVTKECPLCLSQIPFKARRCSHCTADLSAAA